MEDIKRIELTLEPNTQHCIVSEYESPPNCPVDLGWKCVVEMDLDGVVEMVVKMLERPTAQRISVPALQQFIGLDEREVLETAICTLIDAAAGTPHVISLPTLRFVPGAFLFWGDCAYLNELIWRKSVEANVPVLNIHKTFMSRQGREWITAASLYSEFCSGEGFGTLLNEAGMCRYTSRLCRFHMNGFGNEAPVTMPPEIRPIDLWRTFLYTENETMAAMLVDMGYTCEGKAAVQAKKKAKAKGELSKGDKKVKGEKVLCQQEPVPMEVEPEGGDGPVVPVPVPVNVKRQRTNVLSYRRPADYTVISIDKSTFKEMIRDNGLLREDLRKVSSVLVANDETIKQLKLEVERFERQAIVAKSRHRECKRLLSKSGDEAMADLREWKDLKSDLETTIKDLEWDVQDGVQERLRLEERIEKGKEALEKEKEKVLAMELKMQAWEDYVRRNRGQ